MVQVDLRKLERIVMAAAAAAASVSIAWGLLLVNSEAEDLRLYYSVVAFAYFGTGLWSGLVLINQCAARLLGSIGAVTTLAGLLIVFSAVWRLLPLSVLDSLWFRKAVWIAVVINACQVPAARVALHAGSSSWQRVLRIFALVLIGLVGGCWLAVIVLSRTI